uniref:Calmodulin binding protein-like N-terminal domain-containing protein n=1 Tax=Oryza punctata TaxID=4537 RepID=A0A0E0LV14_ORYPU
MVKQVQTLFVAKSLICSCQSLIQLDELFLETCSVLIALFLVTCWCRRSSRQVSCAARVALRVLRLSPETPPTRPPMWKMAFRFKPKRPIFTGSKIEDVNGNPLEIILVDVDTGAPATISQPLRIEVVPVLGDFPPEDREHWKAEEFQ